MLKIRKTPKTTKRIVVTFDICSSSDILEDVIKTENIDKWWYLLNGLKKHIEKEMNDLDFEIYKFTGDGWILLFDYNYPGCEILKFLSDLSKIFDVNFRNRILDILDTHPDIIGLTFGMDRGTLIELIIKGETEYIGRPINIACRLQNAIKDKDENPQNKVMMTKHLYNTMKDEISNYSHEKVKRILRNISGNRIFHCVKVSLLD